MTDAITETITGAVQSAISGGGPFGALVEMPNGSRYFATNAVTRDHDPTAHAEVQAIRRAAREEQTHDLSGAVLYTSTEPCPMCLASAMWARISRIVYAADQHDAAAAGFDDADFYRQIREGLTSIKMMQEPHPERLAPFETWAENETRIDY